MFKRFFTVTSVAAFVAAGVLAVPAQAATAKAPSSVTVKDKKGDAKRGGLDITKVQMYSATDYEPAYVSITTRKPMDSGDAIEIWLNLDKDKAPDMLIAAGAYSEWTVWKTKSWSKLGKNIADKSCVQLDLNGDNIGVTFTPNCLGKSKTMQVSVATTDITTNKRKDFAPKKFKWSKKIKSWA